jgi:ubiquinone/menaquinone biosynthesis C-methylase UbiE
MNDNVDLSYQLGQFRDNSDSLRRLRRQASIVVNLELAQLEAAGLTAGCSIMDLGCGPGIITTEIARHAVPRRLLALDCNEISLRETRAQLEAANIAEAEVREGNVYTLDAAALGKFDFIYARLVFQHLSNPLGALARIAPCLAEGGRLCICDIDDQWFSAAPACPELPSFLNRAHLAQQARGGNRHIGTSLVHLLHRAGYSDIRSSAMLVSTDLIGKDAFCDLVLGYKLEVVPEADLAVARSEVAAIRQAIDAPDGWGGIAVFFVSASFPGAA